jgi:hypothetical protein
MEHLLLDDQDDFADVSLESFRESPPDGSSRDAHGCLQSARRPRSWRMAMQGIVVRGVEGGCYAKSVAEAAIRRIRPSR